MWLLGVAAPPRGGLTATFLVAYTALLGGLVLVDWIAPPAGARWPRKVGWILTEAVLALLVVQVHGNLVRPALVYLLPASRALLLFGPRAGLAMSLSVWLGYAVNVGLYAWPDKLNEFPNYLSFFLGPYVIAVALSMATVRQARDKQELQALYEDLRAAHQQLQAMHQQAQELAVTQERNRLAREIHDSVAHYLTVINVQLEAAEKLGEPQPERAAAEVRRARRLALECLQEVRRSVAALRAATLDELSLPLALRKLAAEFSDGTGIPVEVEMALPESLQVPAEAALALYRVAQEGLTNVQRHARAQRAVLRVTAHDGTLRLSVQDDGAGPPAAPNGNRDGFGLMGLRERVELLGGTLAFGPRPEGGSALETVLPLNHNV